ncbi:MAG: HAMP domain-containing protein [Deltaproteobacteria bacterium]|nr:MAG: HAMP domain-containing protein [Deltaproteobacteria bacterium]
MLYRSLGFKLICSVSAIAILVIGIYASVNINTQRDQLIQQVIQSSNLVSETIKRSMRYDMLKYQPERLHRAIDTIGAQEGIEKVRIFNYVGEIIYSSDRKEMGTMVDKSSEQCYACHAKEKPFERLTTTARSRIFQTTAGHRVLGMINPIYNEPDCYSASCHVHPQEQKVLGVLDIDVSLADVDGVIFSNKKKMTLFAGVAILGISLTIGLFIQRFVSRPVRHLLRGTERVAAGDLSTPLEISSKNEIGTLATSFDQMTQRIESSEKELKASEEKYRSLFDNDPNPILVFDRSTFQIIDANIRATEKYGYSREELLQMSFRDLGDPEDAEKIRSSVVEACIFLPKIRHRKKDGTIMHVDIHSCPREHLGEDVIIANIADISDSIQAEAQLIQASKMATLGEMSAGVAHELNQPLNAIRIGGDLLKKLVERGENPEPKLLAKVSGEIGAQVERAANIINHLREFGRKSDSGELEKVNINNPIRDVFTVLGQQFKLRQIKVNLELDENLPPIYGVSNRLEQVFINLVMNARDAMEQMLESGQQEKWEPVLNIRTYQEKGRVVAVIRDNGYGIPESVKEKIFEPFFTTKEVGRGTGLGLSISYGIIKDYEGTIEVESMVGSGTIFRITFPALANQEGLQKGI